MNVQILLERESSTAQGAYVWAPPLVNASNMTIQVMSEVERSTADRTHHLVAKCGIKIRNWEAKKRGMMMNAICDGDQVKSGIYTKQAAKWAKIIQHNTKSNQHLNAISHGNCY